MANDNKSLAQTVEKCKRLFGFLPVIRAFSTTNCDGDFKYCEKNVNS